VAELAQAVTAQQPGQLVKVPGIGKKTAERLLLELKGKLADAGGTAAPGTAPSDARDDILNALLALGYNDKEASAALKQLPADVATADGIRQALKLLSKV
jgi:Holliday junction DNA helicase RuvA